MLPVWVRSREFQWTQAPTDDKHRSAHVTPIAFPNLQTSYQAIFLWHLVFERSHVINFGSHLTSDIIHVCLRNLHDPNTSTVDESIIVLLPYSNEPTSMCWGSRLLQRAWPWLNAWPWLTLSISCLNSRRSFASSLTNSKSARRCFLSLSSWVYGHGMAPHWKHSGCNVSKWCLLITRLL